MRIVYSFLTLVAVAVLWMLPVSSAIYDFRTDIQEDTWYNNTTAGTSENFTLHKAIYDSDTSEVTFTSTLASDNCTPGTYYSSTTRVFQVNGLAAGGTRDLTISYPVDALSSYGSALNVFMNMLPWVWILILISFPCVALLAIWYWKIGA